MEREIKIDDILQIKSKRGSIINAKIVDITDKSVFFYDINYPQVGRCSFLKTTLFGTYYSIKIIN